MKKRILLLSIVILFVACKTEHKKELSYLSFGGEISNKELLSNDQVVETYKNLKVGDTINMKFNLGIFPISVNISRANYKKFKNFFEAIIHKFFNLKANPDSYNTKSILLLD